MLLVDYLYFYKLTLNHLQLSLNLCETHLNIFEEFPILIATSTMRYLNLLISDLLLLIYHLFSRNRSQALLFFRYYYFLFSLFSIIILFLLFNSRALITANSSLTKRDLWFSCVEPRGLNTNVKFCHFIRIICTYLLIIPGKVCKTHFNLSLLADSAIFGQITICHQETPLLSRYYLYSCYF